MAINPNIGGGLTGPSDFQQAREARQTRLDARVQSAVLTPTAPFTSGQIREHQGFYNSSVGHLDSLKSSNSLQNVDAGQLNRCFPNGDEARVGTATNPTPTDNSQATRLRGEFAAAYAEGNRERTQASRTADQMGVGQFGMPNGDQVNVSQDGDTTSVRTTRQDGSNKTVSYGPGNSVSVDRNVTMPLTTPGHEVRVAQASDDYLPVILPQAPWESQGSSANQMADSAFTGEYLWAAVNVAGAANAVGAVNAAVYANAAAATEVGAALVALAVIAVVLI